MQKFYDGTKLLSLKDINGNTPEIYICTSNRSAGKTTYFNRMVVNRFLKKESKFCLVYRFVYELENVVDKFFKDIQHLFFNEYTMTARPIGRGIYIELYINDKMCGYAIALNNADQLKKYSHIFSDVGSMLFDEFMSETNHYCPQEVEKLLSIHTSIARGGGKQSRYVPIYMISNPVSLLNPYYTALNISHRIQSDTHFLRGDGFVLEQGFNESASTAQKESAFNRAFSGSKYLDYSNEGVYLNDDSTFIEKPVGANRYIATLRFKGCDYGLREYPDLGIMYCDNRPDASYPTKLAVTTNDHTINYVMLNNRKTMINALRSLFEHGCFRFSNLSAKECVFTLLSL